ncbi:hypothetical protein [Pseudarthrobacter sp. MM222]|uniref:hypothetical protein n=1 Tax=Pseudarthrobacter sp. MM222 TaxID=3018929 RepID=UPI00221ECCC5|nr:hypothetical protein [Pseudarthrobacter sp. MM222]CAI3798243.1 hypothetical protein NKCBBBOE_02028 [Pseudarthrobacter sp. MM222]
MRTANHTARIDQVRHVPENFMVRLAKGKEWATPGVETALQRVLAGLDTGLESASPRVQAALRRIADELAGGVETLTPRVHEGLKRVAPKGAPVIPDPGPAKAPRSGPRKTWLIAALLAVALAAAARWRSFRTHKEEPVSPVKVETNNGATPDAGNAPADAGI